MIAPVMIACGERYVKTAVISVNSFLKYHNIPLFVITDVDGMETLSSIYDSKYLWLIDIEKPLTQVLETVKFASYGVIEVDKDGDHKRIYSALKPLIMEAAINNQNVDSKYILGLDADTIFTGDILKIVTSYLHSYDHMYDLYLIQRTDERMQLSGNRHPGSGFTLWHRDGNFIDLFRSNLDDQCTWAKKGGSQRIICDVSQMESVSFMELKDPFLHFISPDVVNAELTDEEIIKFKPAYIHLHGYNSYRRLLNFERIFCGL